MHPSFRFRVRGWSLREAPTLVVLRKPVTDLSEAALARFVARARRAARLKGLVDVLVTSSQAMKSLNRRFRGKNYPTDVLSFPAVATRSHKFAGEIAISAEIAAQNARRLGHPAAAEVRILVLHGILHLRGYDHERDHGQMARLETRLRTRLRLPSGLIERSGTESLAGNSARTRRRPAAASVKPSQPRPPAHGRARRK